MTLPLSAVLLAVSAFADPPPRVGVKDAGGCTVEQRAAINQAVPEAKSRAEKARDFVKSSAEGSDADAKKKLAAYFKLVDTSYDETQLPGFEKELGQIADIIGKADYHCSAPSDKHCGMRAGYVNRADDALIVHLCPLYFKDQPSSQASTLDHEAAHLLDDRITDLDDQGHSSYCGLYDCEGRCSDGPTVDGKHRPYFVADNWAQFIYCASGQEPQEMVITASPKKK